MRFHLYANCLLMVTCLLLLQNSACGSSGEGKANMAAEPEKHQTTQYSFDFPDLTKEHIGQNYRNVNYNIHKNKLFNFSALINRNWDAVKITEPEMLSHTGSMAEIGIFNLYSPSHDPKGDLKAQIIIYIAEVPKDISAADYMDKQIPLLLKSQRFQILQSKGRDTSLGPTKDILISYNTGKTEFLSRICAFKVKDDTKEYLIGEKHLLYWLQISTNKSDYENYGAEAFYVLKISFQLE